MGKSITVAVRKGGTGKTTTSVALAQFARRCGLSVALVDLDPQANATRRVVDSSALNGALQSQDLFSSKPINKPVAFVRHAGRDVMPPAPVEAVMLGTEGASGFAIIGATAALDGMERLPFEAAPAFGERLRELTEHFDLVVVDTPPTLGFGMLAPLHGSDFVLSPINPDADCADGVKAVYAKIAEIQAGPNKKLKFLGVLMTRVEGHDTTHQAVLASIKRSLGNQVLPHEIGERTAIRRTRLTYRPVWVDARSGSDRVAKQEVTTAMSDLLSRMDLGVTAEALA
ncbi:MAG: ParA family protein [Gammaproteobacteria bacterium]|nr:ParA family protein [Gammaproteobacteria bacterium]